MSCSSGVKRQSSELTASGVAQVAWRSIISTDKHKKLVPSRAFHTTSVIRPIHVIQCRACALISRFKIIEVKHLGQDVTTFLDSSACFNCFQRLALISSLTTEARRLSCHLSRIWALTAAIEQKWSMSKGRRRNRGKETGQKEVGTSGFQGFCTVSQMHSPSIHRSCRL